MDEFSFSQMGNIINQMNVQSETAYANFANSLPQVTAMTSSAYNFVNANNAAINAGLQAQAQNVLQSVNKLATANLNYDYNLAQQAPGQYSNLSQNAGNNKW